ncbi:MAG TPA: MBL fold metallo-hydrolase [Rhizomicrobium sp.]|jgi:ribonuclease Z|nr:MBL fold metallo-hydrolase [Rhizomicrobium sp.]
MSRRTRLILILIAAGIPEILLLAWLALNSHPVLDWLFRRTAFHELSRPSPVLAGRDELAALLCGTGSPLPDKTRGGPCTLIAAGGRYYLVDTGLDAARDLMLWRIPLEKIAGVFLTHFHSDHIGDLGEVRLQTWVAGRKAPLPVYGPPGVDRVANGFNEAYALDDGYRTQHHGAALLPPDAAALDPHAVRPGVVLDTDGLKVTAFLVEHRPATPAYGYRFDFHGRSIVVSGDTAPTENLVRAAMGADVLIHEGLSPEMVGVMHDALVAAGKPRQAKIFHDIPGYHTAPVAAARIANEAKVRLLVFTHIIPMLPNRFAEKLFLNGVSDLRADGVELGHDGLLLKLPAGTTRIVETELN